jgi:hypothetical protein
MIQKEKNIIYPHDKYPEVGLLRLAARGVDPNLAPKDEDFQWIVNNLKNHKPVILFKWFWRHEDVDLFSTKYMKDIEPENMEWYLQKLSKMIVKRKNLHWIERINLFHIYGLSRLVDKNLGLKIVKNFPFFQKKESSIISMSDLSACNVSLMLRDASAKDSIKLIDSIKNRSLLSDYGIYQIYYYEGISNLLDTLISYLSSSKQVIIPQTIAGLFEAEPHSLILSKIIKERIYDQLLHNFSQDIVSEIEKKDKKL